MRTAFAFFLAFTLILATVNDAQVAAFSFSGLKEKASKFWNTVKTAGAGAVVGAIAGAVVCGIFSGGTLSAVCAAGGAKVGAIAGAVIGGIYGAIKNYVLGGDEDKNTISMNSERYANTTTVSTDSDLSDLKYITENANKEAYKAIAEVSAKLRSDLAKYDTAESGATGDIIATVWGPEKIYGFSAFPIQIKLEFRKSPIPFNYIHLRKVTVYLKDEDGRVYWARTWDYGQGSEGLNGGQAVYTTIMKVPDDYVGTIERIIETGVLSKEDVEKLFNATTKSFEIYVNIDAYREVWQSTNDTQETCIGNKKWDPSTNTCYEFVKTVDIDYSVHTISAWRHVTRASDIVLIDKGMYASIPTKFLSTEYASKWSIYKEKFGGAVSNVFVITAATPVHMIGSTADFMFTFARNPGYFDPLNPEITDDFRLVVVKVTKSGDYEVADSIRGNLGALTSSIEKQLSARYTDDPAAVTYKVYGFALFKIKRDDNTTIKTWLAVEPLISVLQNERLKLDDTQVEQLTKLVKDNEISEADREHIVAQANEWITGLQDKITEVEELKEKAQAQNNQKAIDYAEKAIKEYKAAIKDLEKVKSTKSVQTLLNYLNAAKKHEISGDYYKNAAYKALHNEHEQAELDAKKAEETSKLAKQYEPSIALTLAGLDIPLDTDDIIVLAVGLLLALVLSRVLGNSWGLLGLLIILGWFLGKYAGVLDFLLEVIR
ncbi:hypothetical protein [Pyrococcus kukulkanii]|uniref:hypothetical protein n=1 Tax=Pyrococcus kukulkanii TaxID=1609559 RepID=UPI003564A79D